MNLSSLEHTIKALLIQLIIGLLSGSWWAGAAAGSFFFLGREHAQAEYRWIETFGSHRRSYMPWWGGFDKRVWGIHSWWWNLLLPIAGVVTLASLITFKGN